jgi:PAS domain S-box-containing protein
VPPHVDRGAGAPFATQPLGRQRSTANTASEPPLNVLVIDGVADDRKAVRRALEGGGVALQEAADAERGLKLAKTSAFDCILVDVLLPDAAGLDVLESLRQPDGTLPCAVVMLTGVRTVDTIAAVIKAGALDYLATDRLDADTVRRTVRSAVRQFRLIDAQRMSDQRNAQLAAIVAASADAIVSIGTDLTVQTWNAGAQRLFGYGEAEARGRSIAELIVPEASVAKCSSIYAAAMKRRAAVIKKTVRRHKDGRLVPVEITVSPMLDGTDRITGFSTVFRDIGERQRAEEVQARLAAIVTSSADAIISETLDGAVTSWNKAAERMFGYPASEMIGQPGRRLVPADRRREENQILDCLCRGEHIERYETTRLARDGRTFDASVSVSPVRDAEGRVIGVSKIIADITERKRTEARLAEREAQLALFVEHAPAAIAMFDTDMVCLAASRRFISDYRVPENVKVVGVSHYEAFPEIPPRWRDVHARVLAGEELSADEDMFIRPDGRTDWSRWSMKPWRTLDGRIGGALLFTEVITAQVEARRALAESEARFRATFENAAVGIAHIAPDGRWLRVNEALCRILDYPADELLARSFQDVIHPDDLEKDLTHLEQMRDGTACSCGIDRRYRRKDGTIVWGRRTLSCVRNGDGAVDYFVIVVEDITARKNAEGDLRKSEERFRSSLVHSPLPTLLFDDREQILALSQSWVEESGYSSEELHCIADWTTRAYGNGADEAHERLRAIITARPEAQRSEMTVRTKDGRERQWSFVNSCLGTQSDGRRLFVCMAQDVTERKAHEEQVNLLMREVTHRAKNMLSLVHAIARQTAARAPEDFIERFTERIQALAANQDLLVRNDWRGVDVADLVRAQLAHFADLVGARIVVRGPALRLNAAAAQAIGLALHELATNAGKYGALSTDGGRVDVRWRLKNGFFTMGWTERDGPPVSPPERPGFGSTVITAMAERTVGGKVHLEYAPAGVTWRLTCRAASALEGGRDGRQTQPVRPSP